MAKTKDTTDSVSVKPIIFSGEMVRTLLDGRKTQTRRVMKVQPPKNEDFRGSYFGVCRSIADGFRYFSCNQYDRAPKHPHKWELDGSVGVARDAGFPKEYFCPMAIGDLLWVRETWRGIVKINAPWEPYKEGVARYVPDSRICKGVEFKASHVSNNEPWQPSIHMPRWASRLTLRVTNVRAERLQDISEDDARAEGVRKEEFGRHSLWSGRETERPTLSSAKQAFLDHVWTDLYGEHETKSVGANPWVWVYEFEVIHKNVDEVN
ncbi:hypothetical protein HK16_19745 [Acetobacter senegalensis]|uniref:Morphogenetic protein n=2 Tax=Acetobacter TaxID=434 RepID=A0A252EF97_9PROT|nr:MULTISPECIES: hypothetical protein [Acetobacter]ATJ91558.1 hypothetical protein CIW82_13500 [Acetobacter tropicalis]OUL64996.1 hypothetical protein HK16_19745 [Acetobacter senegalensis]